MKGKLAKNGFMPLGWRVNFPKKNKFLKHDQKNPFKKRVFQLNQ